MKYTNDYTNEISFPIGGIGSGSVGLSGSGRFTDWEIFNRPSKGSLNGYSHFAVKAVMGDKHICKVLNGDLDKDLTGQYSGIDGYGFGSSSQTMCGFPHFENVEFEGEFPMAKLTFSDAVFPGKIKMSAFNPFIPGDADNSSIPAAFFEIEIENTSDSEIEYQTVLSIRNPFEKSHNEIKCRNGYRMIKMYNAGADKDDVEYGDLTIATDCKSSFAQTY